MFELHPSRPEEIGRLKEIWRLSFGDSEEYMENFFTRYYRPERVLTMRDEGIIQAMAAWFETWLVTADGSRRRVAYLYALATHPQARGQGMAGILLKYADFYLGERQGFQGVSTVPAEPGLHGFFAANGYQEYFETEEQEVQPGPAGAGRLEEIAAEEYGRLREELLAGTDHVAYPREALEYQAGCCRAAGGGLFRWEGPEGVSCLCVEDAGDGVMVVKELLGPGEPLGALAERFPGRRWKVRRPGAGTAFGMLKWLEPNLALKWDWTARAYMGLAFD